jgi:hypothetical protein
MTRKIRVPSRNPRNPSRQASQRDRLTLLLRAEAVVELPEVDEEANAEANAEANVEANDEAVPVVVVAAVVPAEADTRMTMVRNPLPEIQSSKADWASI